MPSPIDDRIAHLEAELAQLKAQLKAQMAPTPRWQPPRLSLARRLAVVALALALTVPAGVVLASHRFNDVPTNHQFHGAISAVADAGITTGCSQGTNNYCPNGLVTRGQMAAFLSRLGALAPGSAPKVNADRVDGRHASDLTRVASYTATADTEIPTTGALIQYGANLVITAPAAGFVTVNYGFTVQSGSCAANCLASGRVRHVESGANTLVADVYVPASAPIGSASVHRVFPVNQGVNTFRLLLSRFGNSGEVFGTSASGTALYTPFGSTGGSTLSLDGE